ncbi:MAG TPA: hypothetical protein VHP33_24430 [Polyangiaceae bacterium]|nr:hypothetical protein [Polyangiaceae bacterium]
MATRTYGWLLRLGALALCAALVPRALLSTPPSVVELGRSVARDVSSGVGADSFHTGSQRFDGEWAFGTYLMATLGLGQVALLHPEERARFLPAMEQSAARLIAKETNAFGTEAWGNVGLEHLADGQGHGYLGYANLALSMLRLVHTETHYAKLNDELTEALARRLAAAPHALFETYPGESYAPDIAMVAGSIALHDCAVGAPPRAFMPAWRTAFSRYIDADSGLLHQAASAETGVTFDKPRGSGTAISAYALSFADPELSRKLFNGLRRQTLNVLGFGMMREYAAGQAGAGDIDSGPVFLGVGVSATGFSAAAARVHRDDQLFTALYRTVDLFGVPLDNGNESHFMSGGPLGNAILLAMLSAGPDFSRHCRRVAS